MRGDLLRHGTAGADGNAEDDEIGILHGLRIGRHDLIDDAELGDPRACLLRARGGDDLAGQALELRSARDRAADQAEADQRDALEVRISIHLPPMKSCKASITRRLASSVPMVMRSACGRP